jgi:hypothetical protein
MLNGMTSLGTAPMAPTSDIRVECPECLHERGTQPVQVWRWIATRLGATLKPRRPECNEPSSYDTNSCDCENAFHRVQQQG